MTVAVVPNDVRLHRATRTEATSDEPLPRTCTDEPANMHDEYQWWGDVGGMLQHALRRASDTLRDDTRHHSGRCAHDSRRNLIPDAPGTWLVSHLSDKVMTLRISSHGWSACNCPTSCLRSFLDWLGGKGNYDGISNLTWFSERVFSTVRVPAMVKQF